MALKKFKPTTPARRQMSVSSFDEVTRTKPEKSLTKIAKKITGRNNSGRITVRHRGGGNKRLYRIIDFKRFDKKNIEGKVFSVEYDPNRTAYIMLVVYKDGEKRYHLAPEGVKVGESIMTAEKAKIKVGNRMKIVNIPVGYEIYNVEMKKEKGGQLGRSAGSSLKLVSLEGAHAQVQMPSGEIRLVEKEGYATIGQVSNIDHNNIVIGKAGRMRHKGRRPQVRGKAMNPVDHPHGGGEGGSPIGMKHPKTPWGMPALGLKTRRRKYTDKMIVKDRRRK
ncbi:50S ribosomal protein L2 [Candidatus Peregrinibacteria bacterium]|mgnify:CR=1 FL=1|jgi:large subunit ribosomal protein L2|nr:50S ribosomal protein L2 [Candidatus Peregrinibacteria bacterium]MBT6401815.1 50S ribosomal protein L2 [candidate division WWE3 bacterium]